YLESVGAAWPWIAAAAALAAAVGALVWRRPAARFVVVAIALLLAPTWIIPLAKMMAAERRMYLPLAGLVTLALVGGWRALAPHWSRGLRVVTASGLVGLVALFFGLSSLRLGDYASAVALWQQTVRQQPADAL